MNFQAFDAVMVLLLFVVLPAYGAWKIRRLRAAAESSPDRRAMYRWTMAMEWGLALAVVLRWRVANPDLSGLGLGFVGGAGWWVGLGLGVLASAALVVQSVVIARSPEKLGAVRRTLDGLSDLLPGSRQEERSFAMLSVTAGICEEILYRGFLMAILTPALGLTGAVVVSSIAFGLGHAYQGPLGVLKTAGVGAVMAGLYVLTGSLWVSMLVHAVLDLNGGYLGRRSLEAPASTSEPVCC